MGAKNFLPRFNATGGTNPDIGSNTLTIHGEGSFGQGQNLTARWGTIFANQGNFTGNLSIGQGSSSTDSTSTTNQITFGDDFYIGQNNSATILSIGTGTDVSANNILLLSSSSIIPSVNITSSNAITGSLLNATTFFAGPAFHPTSANFIVYEGTADDHETTMTITDPTADRTITFPDASGTVALTSDITGTVDTSGSPVDDDFAKFTDANTIEGRSIAETKSDLSLDNVENKSSATIRGEIVSGDIPNNAADTSGQAGTVATIAGLAPDTATTQATQPNITTMTGFVTGSANQLITDDGDGTVTSESNLTFDGDDLNVTSSSASRPKLTITNTNVSSKGPNLFLVNDKGAAGALNDEAGTITFKSDNASQSLISYGSITAKAIGVIAGDESGTLVLSAASSNGSSSNLRNVITGTGSVSADIVNVTLGYGSSSTTTVVGDAVITGNIELGNASDTTISRSAAGTVTIEGNEIQTKNVHHHFLNAGFFLNFPFSRYIPLNGSISEQNTATFSPEYVNFTWPYDGFVKKMMLRTETDMGSTELKLYKGASGAAVTTALGAVTQTVDASDAVEFDFTSVTNTYSKGDTMAVRIDPTDDPDGGQNITIELVFDLTT
tara:strand:+ start:232 stop:2070 length:1839 start_codon:yes stop_codon:yes gene_type:complete